MVTSRRLYHESDSLPRESVLVREALNNISICLEAGKTQLADDNAESAYDVLQSAVDFLPKIAARAMSWNDQLLLRSQGSGVAGLAAAAALQLGRPPFEALRLLEIGRYVVSSLSRRLQAAARLSNHLGPEDLIDEHYDMVRTFLRRGPSLTKADYAKLNETFDQISAELGETGEDSQPQTDFESMKLPVSEDDLTNLAAPGPIVVFNVVKYRSDVLIVTHDGIKALRLPKLRYEELHDKLKSLSMLGRGSKNRKAVPVRRNDGPGEVGAILQWLWDVAVGPVLQTAEVAEAKRVWWMTNGIMALAPIHAAGDHSRGSRDNTMGRVINSYTSCFRTLAYARRASTGSEQLHKALLITMPRTPGLAKLNVKAETRSLKASFGDHLEIRKQPTCEQVLSLVPHYSIIHLACHGYLSHVSPFDSGIFLAEGFQAKLLSISSLERVSACHAQLAYLAACSTAEMTYGIRADEAINLANCFQILGFRHVIGTIWSASDVSAGSVASKFYARLKSQIDSNDQRMDVASALHGAVQEYKAECVGDDGPLHWAPYIHIGS